MRYGGREGRGKKRNIIVTVKHTYNNEPPFASASASTKVRYNNIFIRVIRVEVLVHRFRRVDDEAKYVPNNEPQQVGR